MKHWVGFGVMLAIGLPTLAHAAGSQSTAAVANTQAQIVRNPKAPPAPKGANKPVSAVGLSTGSMGAVRAENIDVPASSGGRKPMLRFNSPKGGKGVTQ